MREWTPPTYLNLEERRLIEMFLQNLRIPDCLFDDLTPPPDDGTFGENAVYWPGGWRRLSRIKNLFENASRTFSGTWDRTFAFDSTYGILVPGQSGTLVLDCGTPIAPLAVIGWVPEWSSDGVSWQSYGDLLASADITSGGLPNITAGDTLVPSDKRIIYNQGIADNFVDPFVTAYVDGIDGEAPGFTRVLRNWPWSPESGVPYVWLYKRVSARYWRFVFSNGSTYTGATPGLNTTTVTNLFATDSAGAV